MPDSVRAALVFVEDLTNTDFAKALEAFDPSVRAAVTDQGLAQMWAQIVSIFGQPKKHVATRTARTIAGANDIVYLSWDFEKERLDARVVVNAAAKLIGVSFETPVIK